MESKKKGRLHVICPEHKGGHKFGEKTCMKRLYFKPGNKLKSIEQLWICQSTGIIYIASITEKIGPYPKQSERILKKIGKVDYWEMKFPELV